MNAHASITREHTVEFEALSNLEPLLGRAAALASTAAVVVEHELGRQHPAEELTALLQVIAETLASAEAIRGQGFRGAHDRRHG